MSRKKQSGSVLVLIVIAMLAMLGIAGLAMDGGHAMLNKTRLQNTVDAAALSGEGLPACALRLSDAYN